MVDRAPRKGEIMRDYVMRVMAEQVSHDVDMVWVRTMHRWRKRRFRRVRRANRRRRGW